MDFDYESIRSRMITNLKKRASWKNVLPISVNVKMIETVAEEIAELARYDEYLLRESKWDLARNVSSLVNQSIMLGYQPHRKVGATGVVQVSSNELAFSDPWLEYEAYNEDDYVRHNNKIWKCTSDEVTEEPSSTATNWTRVRTFHTSNIGIPKWCQFTGSNGLTYTGVEAVTLLASQDYTSVNVVQGTPQLYTATATGDTFEEVYIEDGSIEENVYEVYVNGVKWTEIDNLRNAEATDTKFQTILHPNFEGVYFRFGDNITGKKPNSGNTISIYWIKTDGALGNISTLGGITGISTTISDVTGSVVPMYTWNYNTIAGGKGNEDIESIRRNGTFTFQSGDRLVSVPDYKVFLESEFDFIGKAVVWGAYEQNLDAGNDPWEYIAADENLIYIAAITPGSTPIDFLKNADGSDRDDYKTTLIEAMRELKSPTDVVSFENVEFIYVTAESTIYVDNANYSLAEMVTTVTETIMEEYGIENLLFKQAIYASNYNRVIDTVDGVRYHNTEFAFYRLTEFSSSSYDIADILPLPTIETGSVTVYAIRGSNTFTIATDDGSGNLVAESGYTLSAGASIVYSTGAIALTVASGLSEPYQEYTIKITYDTVDDDLVPTKRYQILYFNEDAISITAEYYEE